jgi:hypothetical protein
MSSLDETKPLIGRDRRYNSTWHCVKDTFNEEGLRGIHRGLGVTMLRAFIGTFVPVRLKLIEKSMLLRFTVTNGSKRVWNGDKLK